MFRRGSPPSSPWVRPRLVVTEIDRVIIRRRHPREVMEACLAVSTREDWSY
jgi:hypothetical protein